MELKKRYRISEENDAIHTWFNLTYASYLILPRTMLQSMPDEWQKRFVRCLEDLRDAIPDEYLLPSDMTYNISLKNDRNGRYVPIQNDPLCNYERGRRRISLNTVK